MSLDLEKTRFSTHEKLVSRLDQVASGEDIKSLESFAKAYLCMYLDLDKFLEPEQRVAQLTEADDLDVIWSGFSAVLNQQQELTAEQIGEAYARTDRLALGYIMLAALDHGMKSSPDVTASLSDHSLVLLNCFHFANRHELSNRWLPYSIENKSELFAQSMLDFWQGIRQAGGVKYAGFREILMHEEYLPVLQRLARPIMEQFPDLNKKLLLPLLLFAWQHMERTDLLEVVEQNIAGASELHMANQVYWQVLAYLLAPEKYQDMMLEYVGRTREKALPMLNLVYAILNYDSERGAPCSADMLAHLIYFLAPRFRPIRDQFGRLDDNAEKINYLFELLAADSSDAARQAVQYLRKIRVMRLYSSFLDSVDIAHQSK